MQFVGYERFEMKVFSVSDPRLSAVFICLICLIMCQERPTDAIFVCQERFGNITTDF